MHNPANNDWVAWLLRSDQEIFTQSRYRHHAAFITYCVQYIQYQAQAIRTLLQDLRDDTTHFHEVDTELALQECSATIRRLLPEANLKIELHTQLKMQPSVINSVMKIDALQPLNGCYNIPQITLTFMLVCNDLATFRAATHMIWSNVFSNYFSQIHVAVRATLDESSLQLDRTCYLFFLFR